MSFGKTSWLAILPLLIVWLVINLVMTERVETELATRAVAAVGTVIAKPSVSVAGRDPILSGLAFSTQGSELALRAVRDAAGVRRVENAIILVPIAQPYAFERKRDGDRLVLSGNVPDPAMRAKLLLIAKASAPGTSVVDDMTYAREPAFADMLVKGSILFETGLASIQPDSDAVLDNLTAIAMRCPEAQIEISGHADSVGDDDANMGLSRRRAEAVAGYLIKAGIAAERMTAVGYGKTHPIASNDTEEGPAQKPTYRV